MSILAKVRGGYTLQVGRDPGNWIKGPARIRVKDKTLLRGQMHKIEVIEDDGSPDPKPERPARSQPPPPPRTIQGSDVQIPGTETTPTRQVLREEGLRATDPKAADIIRRNDERIQARARERVAEALGEEPGARSRSEIELVGDEVLSVAQFEEPETAASPAVEPAILTQARPMTTPVGAVEIVEDDVPEIGANAEARLAAAAEAPPPPATNDAGFVVRGVPKERLKLALQIAASFDPARTAKALKLYDGVEKGLVHVFEPPALRDALQHAREEADAGASALQTQVDLLEARLAETEKVGLERGQQIDVLREQVAEEESVADGLRKQVAEQEKRRAEAETSADELLVELAKVNEAREEDGKMLETYKNRLLGSATTRKPAVAAKKKKPTGHKPPKKKPAEEAKIEGT